MKYSFLFPSILLLVLVQALATADDPASARQRTFRLDYGATLTDLPAGSEVRIWLPVPQSNEDQTVKPLARKLPVQGSEGEEAKYGNRILSFAAAAPGS